MIKNRTEQLIERVFNAPRERVWQAWTDPEQVIRWWGPAHFTSPACKINLQVGGTYHFCMQSPDGDKFWSTGTYQEIVPQERLVYTDNFADEAGNVVPASYYNMPGDWPDAVLITVTFEDSGNQTKLTLRQVGVPAEMSEMAEAGWNQSLDKLAESLK